VLADEGTLLLSAPRPATDRGAEAGLGEGSPGPHDKAIRDLRSLFVLDRTSASVTTVHLDPASVRDVMVGTYRAAGRSRHPASPASRTWE